MFTVKLTRGHVMKLLQAERIDVYPVGPAETGCAANPKDRTTDVIELALQTGVNVDAFYLAHTYNARPSGWADSVEFFDAAYIENEHGATTQIVRPY